MYRSRACCCVSFSPVDSRFAKKNRLMVKSSLPTLRRLSVETLEWKDSTGIFFVSMALALTFSKALLATCDKCAKWRSALL